MMQTAKDMLTNLFGTKAGTTCEVCGNVYDGCFEVHMNGETHTFDCFECAVHALAPHCVHCGCSIIGHGVEANGLFYCCTHCARQNNVQLADANEMPERSPA
jgi:hypothetical protein